VEEIRKQTIKAIADIKDKSPAPKMIQATITADMMTTREGDKMIADENSEIVTSRVTNQDIERLRK